MFTLQNLISKRAKGAAGNWQDADLSLTIEQANQFMKVFGERCSQKTKAILTHAIKDNFSHVRSAGILDRVRFDDNGIPCSYCAGQDYPGEVAYIRNYIKKFY